MSRRLISQALPEQRLGAGEIAVQPQDRREIAQADRGFAVFVAEHLAPDRQRLAMQRLGALVESLILVDAAELRQRDRDVRVLRPEQLCGACAAPRSRRRPAAA